MRPETIDYIKRHPYARTSAIVARDRRNETTAKLQSENEARAAAAKRVNEYRDEIGYDVGVARNWIGATLRFARSIIMRGARNA